MKTTVDIPDDLFKQVMRISKARTKRDAILHALEQLIREEKKSEVLSYLGTSETFMTHEELMDMRMERGKFAPKKK